MDKTKVKNIVKAVVVPVCIIGSSIVVQNVVASFMPKEVKLVGKILIAAGTISISGLVSTSVGDYVCGVIDEAFGDKVVNPIVS